MNLKDYFIDYPIVTNSFLKVNEEIGANTSAPMYISKDNIKGFKITECSGDKYDISYTIEVVFDYKAFNYNIEDSVPEIFSLKEIEEIKEAEYVIEFLLKELYE